MEFQRKLMLLNKKNISYKVGTEKYMAPEMLKIHNYDLSIDIWALGVLLFELCMLQVPFKMKMKY